MARNVEKMYVFSNTLWMWGTGDKGQLGTGKVEKKGMMNVSLWYFKKEEEEFIKDTGEEHLNLRLSGISPQTYSELDPVKVENPHGKGFTSVWCTFIFYFEHAFFGGSYLFYCL